MTTHVLMYMPFYYSIGLHRGIAQYAFENGWRLNISNYRSGHIPRRRWNGIVGTFQVGDGPLEESITDAHKIPLVSLTTAEGIPCVLPDNKAIGEIAADHFIELGYQNFAFYFWQSKQHENVRAQAFASQINTEKRPYFKINFTSKPRLTRQRSLVRIQVLRRFLLKAPKPIAIMAPMDDLAVEIIDLCEEMRLRIPEDVGVLGVNNDHLICNFTAVPLSSIDDDEYKIGYEGAALLARIMNGETPPTQPILIPPKGVVVRRSTDLLEISNSPDRNVAAAVRFIAGNFSQNITETDVARNVGVSIRQLQTRFAKSMGRTIHQQINRKRIEHAKHLLKTTDYKIAHIAAECGFSTREGFSRSFKNTIGISPHDFRQS